MLVAERWDRRSAVLESAARLYGSRTALRTAMNLPPTYLEQASLDRAIGVCRVSLGDAAFATAWSEGERLSLEQAVALGFTLTREIDRAGAADAAPATVSAMKHAAAAPDGSGQPETGAPLSPRERDVAALVARGLTNRQIAAQLSISERTVDGHVARILSRLDFATRAQIAAWATRQGLVRQ